MAREAPSSLGWVWRAVVILVAVVGSVLALKSAVKGIYGSAVSSNAAALPGAPEIVLRSVKVPSDSTQPLALEFDVTNVGGTTISLTQRQFLVSIGTDGQPFLFQGEPVFSGGFPQVMTIEPSAKLTVIVTTDKDIYSGRVWSEVVRGSSRVQIQIGSGKKQEFAHQWLGGTHSNELELRLDVP